jgi:hypothetical protein
MTRNTNCAVLAVFAGAAMLLPVAQAQDTTSKPKPSPYVTTPYSGVSRPPADDAIETSPDTPPAAAQPAAPVTPAPVATTPAPAPAHTYTSTPVSQPVNPDADIVTGPAPEMTVASDNASLHSRPVNPDADIVTSVPRGANELPEGTNIHVTLSQALSTEQTQNGAKFTGRVSKQVMLDGRVVIPEGAEFRGRVVQVTEGRRFGSPATIRLRPEAVVLPDGSRYMLRAQVVGSRVNNTRVDSEGGIRPGTHVKKAAIEESIGAGTGALVGAKIGGGPGALVGSLVGVGVVTTHLLVQHPQSVNVPSNTTIVFSLTEPLELTPVHD